MNTNRHVYELDEWFDMAEVPYRAPRAAPRRAGALTGDCKQVRIARQHTRPNARVGGLIGWEPLGLSECPNYSVDVHDAARERVDGTAPEGPTAPG